MYTRKSDTVTTSATAAEPPNKTISPAAVEFFGLDVDSFEEADIVLTFPLEAGEYVLPTQHAPAIVSVKGDTELGFCFTVRPNDEGNPEVQRADVTLSNSLVIKNPSRAFEPNEGPLGRLRDALVDRLATPLVVQSDAVPDERVDARLAARRVRG